MQRYRRADEAAEALESLVRPTPRATGCAPGRPARSTSLPMLAFRHPPFVGRPQVRRDLAEHLDGILTDGKPRLAWILGPQGSGKNPIGSVAV